MFPRIPFPFLDGSIRTYQSIHGIGIVSFALIGLWITRRERGLGKHWWALALLLGVSHLSLAHMAKMLIRKGPESISTAEFWWPFSSLYWGGPLFFALLCLAYFVFVKRSALLLDAACVSYAFALAIFKVACLSAGCCSGIACELPWAAWFGGKHPTQVYQLLFYAVTGITLLTLFSKQRLAGRLVLVLGVGFGLS